MFLFTFTGVSISDGQDDHFFNMKNSPGFDVAQVQDIGKKESLLFFHKNCGN